MKIILYRPEYAKQFNSQTMMADPVGGTEFAAGYLARELAKTHQVFFICQTPETARIDNIQWLPLDNPAPQNIQKIFQKIGRADILILVGGLSNCLENYAPPVKKIILWANGLSLKANTIKHLCQNKIDQAVCTTAYSRDQVLRNTCKRMPLVEKTKYLVSRKWRQSFRDKFTFIYNGVNSELFPEQLYCSVLKKPFKIIYAGVFNEQKNPDKILAVFGAIKKAIPELELHMCGSIGQYKTGGGDQTTGYFDGDSFFAKIKKYIYDQNNKVRPGIYLRGGLAPATLACEMMSASLVIVNPCVANQESSCIGALEAQAAGTPVLGGGLSALEETIEHGKTGFVFRKQKNLALLVIRLLKNPALLQKIGKAGRARAQAGFGWDILAREWGNLFTALLAGKKFIPKKH